MRLREKERHERLEQGVKGFFPRAIEIGHCRLLKGRCRGWEQGL
jgi:hypothetical protein